MSTQAIEKLSVSSFGPFNNRYELSFLPTINVIVGDNGTGKSQLLKLLYSCTNVLHNGNDDSDLLKTNLQRNIADKLIGVFQPDALGRLATRQQGRARADITVRYHNVKNPLKFSFATNSKTEVRVDSFPSGRLESTPVFLPSRELMSIYPGFVSLYNTRQTSFDETWRDTCDLLGRPPLRRVKGDDIDDAIKPLMDIMGTDVTEEGGRFYLHRQEGVLEMPLVAEGLRKLATIYRLVRSGVLSGSGYLFWDEPEANLNPVSQVAVAQTIVKLADCGVQVFLGTHSSFLMRQLEDEAKSMTVSGLGFTAFKREGVNVTAVQEKRIEDIPVDYLAAINAEYNQADMLLAEDD